MTVENVHPRVSATAFLIADPARASMLMALADGRALPAGELAYAAGVTAQTASSHLAKLLDGGLLAVEKEGRHRYYRLADAQVATLLENLAAIGARAPVRHKPPGREAQKLRFARCCYDHLAGQVGVAITRRLTEAGLITAEADKRFAVTPAGAAWFGELGLDVTALKPGRHGVARQCLDWTERRHHLAGPLGVAFLALLCERGWLRRTPASRAVQVTPRGWIDLRERLGLTPESLAEGSDDSNPR
ncbi:MAG TPA: winged helix-turn-helix domain-containing protein [Paraburkholderia sp.]|uniref:ArsR/SmtB family transcription factor n=1 Tax=Paraburkholderia sp. TaxID=1926495 RepID=UPI002C20E49F|nr:winged helix-turn-helix domain-containing protein [Paraburkholderia sp.]HTR08471.1 winged helix-turn-helix domain-containing protein [Paraburkholderia sp.]